MIKKIINWFKSFHLVEKRFKDVGNFTFELTRVYGNGSTKTRQYYTWAGYWFTLPYKDECSIALSLELSRLKMHLNKSKSEEYIEPQ